MTGRPGIVALLSATAAIGVTILVVLTRQRLQGLAMAQARSKIAALAEAVEAYRDAAGAYPSTVQDTFSPSHGALVAFSAPQFWRDPWGESYIYERTEDGFRISSPGPDKIIGTADDLIVGGSNAHPSRGIKGR